MDSQVHTTHTIESEMVTSRSTETLVEEPLDLYMIYLWVDQNGRFGRPDLGLTDVPFMFEFYAEDARHALEQFDFYDPTAFVGVDDVIITRIEVKQIDPFHNPDHIPPNLDLTNDR